MAGNDTMALGIMETARALKLRIPEDLSVAGFDDDQAARESSPSLTTSHQPIAEMAEFGARKLLYAINSKTVPKGHTTMEPSLVIRESTGKPGSNSRKTSRADR
jgi:LacI family transcriptional regulator